MAHVARYAKMTAKDGRSEELAGLLLQAAEDLAEEPGCLLYLINRQQDAPDTIWVTEMWRSREDLDAVLARIRDSDQVSASMALVASAEMVELDLLGGKGPRASE